MSVQASQFGDELRIVKGDIAEINRLISRLQSEIEAVKAQVHMEATLNSEKCTSGPSWMISCSLPLFSVPV